MGGQRSGVCKASVYLLDSGFEITTNVAILAGVDVVSLQASDSQIACRRCVQNISFEQREHFRLFWLSTHRHECPPHPTCPHIGENLKSLLYIMSLGPYETCSRFC